MRLLPIALTVALAACSGRPAVAPRGGGDEGGERAQGGSGGGRAHEGCGDGSGPFLQECDVDGDGCQGLSCGGADCNDRDPAIHPGAVEDCFNALDDDCDGLIDEDCVCGACDVRWCFPESDAFYLTGACREGLQRCKEDGTGWGACEGLVLPEPETCNGIDDDCDGDVDDGVSNACGGCGPLREICGNGLDDDCDGTIDPPELCSFSCDDLDPEVDLPRLACCLLPRGSDLSGTPCERQDCDGRENQPCYTGPPQTLGKGMCRAGKASCAGAPGARRWTACEGEQLPEVETCNDGVDNDCDGHVDENDGRSLVGCEEGCRSPPPESCGDALDNDCDGLVDESCLADADERICFGGLPGTRGIGACADGIQHRTGVCWGPCEGAVIRSPELCGDGVDSDCDGFGEPGGDEDAGCCEPSGPEACNGHDDDCDGLVDEHVASACGTCADEPCYREELLGPGACRLGTCEGVAVDAGGVLHPVGTGVHRFTRVFRASHATAQWSQLDVPISGRLEARVATTRDGLAAAEPCAASSRPPLDLQTCNRALPARYLQATVTFSGEGWQVASLRLEWTRP